MHRSLFLCFGFFLVSLPAFAQSTSTDSQTLEALLAEVRQLRQDLKTTTAREIGGIQIQNQATVAGNVCNASPAADGVAASREHAASLEAELGYHFIDVAFVHAGFPQRIANERDRARLVVVAILEETRPLRTHGGVFLDAVPLWHHTHHRQTESFASQGHSGPPAACDNLRGITS
jgi:FAD binding domain in molybdopterin dehydrogenase